MSKTLNETVKEFFGFYPKHDTLFATEDGNVFLERNAAENHAREAKIKMIPVTRAEVFGEEEEVIPPVKPKDADDVSDESGDGGEDLESEASEVQKAEVAADSSNGKKAKKSNK